MQLCAVYKLTFTAFMDKVECAPMGSQSSYLHLLTFISRFINWNLKMKQYKRIEDIFLCFVIISSILHIFMNAKQNVILCGQT